MPQFTVFYGSKNGTIVEARTVRPDPTEHEVLVRITHSGLCGTHEHCRHADLVLGHEGAGVVEAVGPKVKTLKR
jgi:Zn-dependent alcohol dehydrogenase